MLGTGEGGPCVTMGEIRGCTAGGGARVVPSSDRLVGLVVKASTSRAEGPGFESRLRRDFFRGRVIPVTSKLALQWLPCQAPGVIGSALGTGRPGVSIL